MYDILEFVGDGPYLVEAEISMYKTEDGGKDVLLQRIIDPIIILTGLKMNVCLLVKLS